METDAVILEGPKALTLGTVGIAAPKGEDLVIDIRHSGISTGTEKLFWSGKMPPFPGMGYPLVPGYEAVGEVMEAAPATGLRPGDTVFVPGASCYEDAFGLFGASAARVVTDAARVTRVDPALGADAVLLALAATARHAIAGPGAAVPDLIVGHGVLGRLLARLTLAAGAPAPTVWEVDPQRRGAAEGYNVIAPEDDARSDYRSIYDASGNGGLLNDLVCRTAKGGEIVLAGFYPDDLSFAYPPAFMREVRFRIAAEWTPGDMTATRALVDSGALSLKGLITHNAAADDAAAAYETAFTDPACLKMILDWSGRA